MLCVHVFELSRLNTIYMKNYVIAFCFYVLIWIFSNGKNTQNKKVIFLN